MDTSRGVDLKRQKIIETVRRLLALAQDQPGTNEGRMAAASAKRLRRAHQLRPEEIDPATAVKDPSFKEEGMRAAFEILAGIVAVPVRWSPRRATAYLDGDKRTHARVVLAFTEMSPYLERGILDVCRQDRVPPHEAWPLVHYGILQQAKAFGLLEEESAPADKQKESKENSSPPPREPVPIPTNTPSRKKDREVSGQISLLAFQLGMAAPGLDFLMSVRIAQGSSAPSPGTD